MKAIKVLSMFLFIIFLVSTVSAFGIIGGAFDDGSLYGVSSITITEGDSISFNYDFIADSSPMVININLHDSETGEIVIPFETNQDITTLCSGLLGSRGYVCHAGEDTISSNINAGSYELIMSADNIGSSKTLYLTVNAIPDTTNPVITVITPQATTYSISDLTFEVSIDEATISVEYSLDGAANVVMTEITTNTFESALLTLADGTYSVEFFATDLAENQASVTVDFTIDTSNKAPVITVIVPEQDKEYSDGDLTFEIEVDEVAEVTFSLNGGSRVTMDFQGTSNTILTFTYDVVLNDGDHTVTFYALDAAGNEASQTVDFSVDTPSTTKKDKDKNDGDDTSNFVNIPANEDNLQNQAYLDQFKQKQTIFITADEGNGDKELSFWQRLINWLKKVFGF